MNNEILLRMEKIVKNFPGVKALDNVDLEVYKGEVLALVGENGAGKTTLMEILNPHPAPTGFYRQDNGSIFFNGKEIKPRNPLEAQKIGISFIHQHFNLALNLTVAENILLGREPCKGAFLKIVDRKKMEDLVDGLLFKLDVKFSSKTLVSDLSVAQKQMVEIAKALSLDAQLIIMDEPTAPLTENEIQKLFEIVKNLKSEGITFIFITHKLDEIFKISDRVVVLRDGSRIGSFDINEASEEEISKMMVGRDLEMFPKREVKIGDSALEVRSLSRKGAIENVSFEVREGEILGIFGLVGAGRTETIRVIFGADKKDCGEIYIKGKKLDIKSPNKAIESGMGLVPEDRQLEGLIPLMNVKENITLSILNKISHFLLIKRKKEEGIVKSYINKLRIITPDMHYLVKGLSGGNQQKVVLAKWLASNPKILILDEPTCGIDVGAKAEIHLIMSQLAGEGIGIIMVSSELPEILKMSDRVLVMAEGRITAEFSSEEATEENIIRCAVG
jgi:ribose transport system ATP-binding protein